MSAKLGRPKHLDKITLKDALANPIWVNTYDEVNYDEEYERPVLSRTVNVTRELLRMYSPIITCKVEGQELYAVGQYDEEGGTLFAMALWMKNKWRAMEEVKELKTPLTLVAIPKILGQKGVRFVLKRVTDAAKRSA
jgi:hypothetical protein